MRQAIFRLSIATITFAVGFSGVWMMRTPTITSIRVDPVSVNEVIGDEPTHEKHRFSPTYRGCKPGYVQGYETDDGHHLSEGVALASGKLGGGFHERIRKATVLKAFPKYRDHRGQVGERYVLQNDDRSVSILWYGGGDFYSFIEAPSLDLALEFQQFLRATDYRAE